MMENKRNPISIERIRLQGGFWGSRQEQMFHTVIMDQYHKMKRKGQFDAFRLDWEEGLSGKPHPFWDSEVYKWLEAASYCLQHTKEKQLDQITDEVIDLVVSAQHPDGYINLYYSVVEPGKKWTDLMDTHELYSAGHLMEAAVAHHEATGKRKLLEAAIRFADLIDMKFGEEPGKLRGYDGHQEVELALVKLYQTTGNEKYLRLSRFFIYERGARPLYYAYEYEQRGDVPHFVEYRLEKKLNWLEYYQVHKPLIEQDEVVGHAVRVMYFCSGIVDVARETNDVQLWEISRKMLENLITKKMYITGGAGNSHHNEGFTTDYELPNDTGYCETCAAIGLVFWTHRLLQSELNGKYGDLLERALYNNVLSGISLDGTRYFYMNPLESNGTYHREPWQGCACCPPNLSRLIGSLGQYMYSSNDREIAVHLYAQNESAFTIEGNLIRLKQMTNYPWNANVAIKLSLERQQSFALKLRIADWFEDTTVLINGVNIDLDGKITNGYLIVDQAWNDGDLLEIRAELSVKRVYSHPLIKGNLGRVALQRGPIVYCLESADQSGIDLERIHLPSSATIQANYEDHLLGGVTVLTGAAHVDSVEDWADALYRSEPPEAEKILFKAIPYFAWDNRDPGQMKVWLREKRDVHHD